MDYLIIVVPKNILDYINENMLILYSKLIYFPTSKSGNTIIIIISIMQMCK